MSKYQIIIPMSGFGNRFKEAGYDRPKPLLIVNEIPVIAHIIDLFPGESDFLFVCNNDHLNNNSFKMREILKKYCPTGKVIGIESHKKGPVHAVLKAKSYINLKKKIIVNYCDFNCYWDWLNFKNILSNNKIDGAIPAYKGFHPHSFGVANYAYIKEKNLKAIDIKEKKPFTKNKIEEYASSGTYYFKSASEMLSAFNYIVKNNLSIKGEFYVSLAYKYYFKKNKNIIIHPLQHFSQWGTPQDFETYNKWSNTFYKIYTESITKDLSDENRIKNSINIFLMAGEGIRFVKEKYEKPKPLIEVSGKPMMLQTISHLPKSKMNMFLIRKNMDKYIDLQKLIIDNFDNPEIQKLDKITTGQASTAFLAISSLKNNQHYLKKSLLIAPCDAGVIFNYKKYMNLLNKSNFDIIVWTSNSYNDAKLKPEMYGWVKSKNNLITKTLVTESPINFDNYSIINGVFTFKNSFIFEKCYSLLKKNNNKINSEYYIDSMVEEALKLNLNCFTFPVDEYLSWGTPYELETYKYWQSYFHKWSKHPYSINEDKHAFNKNKLIKSANTFTFK